MKNKESVWNRFAPVYDIFMRANRPAYREMYAMIRRAIAGKTVLEFHLTLFATFGKIPQTAV